MSIKEDVDAKDEEIKLMNDEISNRDDQIKKLKAMIRFKNNQIKQLKDDVNSQNDQMTAQQDQIHSMDRQIRSQHEELKEINEKIRSKEVQAKRAAKISKGVSMIDLDTSKVLRNFQSARAAARWLIEKGITNNVNCATSIGSACRNFNGKTRKSYGYGWRFTVDL